MKKTFLFSSLILFSLSSCAGANSDSNEKPEDNGIIEKTQIICKKDNQDSIYDEEGFSFKDGNYTFIDGSSKLENDIALPLFATSNWSINFKNLTIENGHVLTFNQDDSASKIYFTFNKIKKIFVIGICNNKKKTNFYNYGFSLPVDNFENIDCSIKYENELFKFVMDKTEYSLNKFNVNQFNNCVANSLERLSSELRSQIIGITNAPYLYLDSIGSLTSKAHLFSGSFEEISVEFSYMKEKLEREENTLDDKNLFFLGSSIFYGHCTGGYGFVDMIKDHNIYTNVTKETVSGTTLAVSGDGNSYIERMEKRINKTSGREYIKEDDALIIQLSTNDFSKGISLGEIENENVISSDSFDKTTISGAIEYICARAKELNPNIKVVFISCPIKSSWGYRTKYKTYVNQHMQKIINKWNIEFIDLLNYDPAASSYVKIDTSSQSGFFFDDIHPNFIGYSALMYPIINEYLVNLFK